MNANAKPDVSGATPVAADDSQSKVPGINIQLVVAMGPGRNLTLMTHCYPDQHDVLNIALDTITRASDRQRSKYEVEEIQEELRRMNLMQGDRKRDLDAINEGTEIESLRKEGDEAAEQWARTGRRGEFKHNQNYIGRLKAAMQNHEQRKRSAQIEYDRHTNEIERLEHEIEKRRKILAEG